MSRKIKTQKGFIQIPLLAMLIVSISVVVGIGYGTVEYHKVSKAVREAEQLAREERYDEAIEKLDLAQNRRFIKNVGIKRQEIADEIEKNKTLLEDKSEYNRGIEEFNKENWVKAKELLSKVSEISPHYQDAKNKIEEAQKKITEEQIPEAVKRAAEEAERRAEEAKKAAEEAKRKTEETPAKKEITAPPKKEKVEMPKEEKIMPLQPSFEINLEPGVRLEGASVPFILKLGDGRFRMYYCGMGGILSALSSDGLNFVKEPGIRINPGLSGSDELVVCDPTVVSLPDGKFRMYYKGGTGGGGPGQSVQKIFSAISTDGLTFQKEGLVIDSIQEDNGFASVPEAIRLPDGRIRIYFVSDGSYVGHGTVSAISADGRTFSRETTKVVAFVDPSITTLPDGRYMLIAAAIPKLPKGIQPAAPAGIYGLTSEDGITFGPAQKILSDGQIWIDPTVVSMGNNIYRVYYWNPKDRPSKIYSLTLRFK
jgi:predicted GH43/DUF377 family glycosyl hydrolase